ncbi:hypothetical protein TNCV_364591 [Trichonephila clavipes]|nr:hypothetical protein TNCV_364591 [Trichonephila clavipes]
MIVCPRFRTTNRYFLVSDIPSPYCNGCFAWSLHTQHQIVQQFLGKEYPFLNQYLFQFLDVLLRTYCLVRRLPKAFHAYSMGFKSDENASQPL